MTPIAPDTLADRRRQAMQLARMLAPMGKSAGAYDHAVDAYRRCVLDDDGIVNMFEVADDLEEIARMLRP